LKLILNILNMELDSIMLCNVFKLKVLFWTFSHNIELKLQNLGFKLDLNVIYDKCEHQVDITCQQGCHFIDAI
jgi:hypothetical protein